MKNTPDVGEGGRYKSLIHAGKKVESGIVPTGPRRPAVQKKKVIQPKGSWEPAKSGPGSEKTSYLGHGKN